MRQLKSIMVYGILLVSPGCIPLSLNPIYTEKDIVFEPGLIGQWAQDGSKETWAFSKRDTNEYDFVYTDEAGKRGRFSAHLVKIDGNLFLDFFPEERDVKENDFYEVHFIPAHSFAHVKQIEPTLQMRFPDPDWLEKLVTENPGAIQHGTIDCPTPSGKKNAPFLLLQRRSCRHSG